MLDSHTPELVAILEQVASEIVAMMAADETGTVAIHIGRGDLQVEITRKRRHKSIRVGDIKATT